MAPGPSGATASGYQSRRALKQDNQMMSMPDRLQVIVDAFQSAPKPLGLQLLLEYSRCPATRPASGAPGADGAGARVPDALLYSGLHND